MLAWVAERRHVSDRRKEIGTWLGLAAAFFLGTCGLHPEKAQASPNPTHDELREALTQLGLNYPPAEEVKQVLAQALVAHQIFTSNTPVAAVETRPPGTTALSMQLLPVIATTWLSAGTHQNFFAPWAQSLAPMLGLSGDEVESWKGRWPAASVHEKNDLYSRFQRLFEIGEQIRFYGINPHYWELVARQLAESASTKAEAAASLVLEAATQAYLIFARWNQKSFGWNDACEDWNFFLPNIEILVVGNIPAPDELFPPANTLQETSSEASLRGRFSSLSPIPIHTVREGLRLIAQKLREAPFLLQPSPNEKFYAESYRALVGLLKESPPQALIYYDKEEALSALLAVREALSNFYSTSAISQEQRLLVLQLLESPAPPPLSEGNSLVSFVKLRLIAWLKGNFQGSLNTKEALAILDELESRLGREALSTDAGKDAIHRWLIQAIQDPANVISPPLANAAKIAEEAELHARVESLIWPLETAHEDETYPLEHSFRSKQVAYRLWRAFVIDTQPYHLSLPVQRVLLEKTRDFISAVEPTTFMKRDYPQLPLVLQAWVGWLCHWYDQYGLAELEKVPAADMARNFFSYWGEYLLLSIEKGLIWPRLAMSLELVSDVQEVESSREEQYQRFFNEVYNKSLQSNGHWRKKQFLDQELDFMEEGEFIRNGAELPMPPDIQRLSLPSLGLGIWQELWKKQPSARRDWPVVRRYLRGLILSTLLRTLQEEPTAVTALHLASQGNQNAAAVVKQLARLAQDTKGYLLTANHGTAAGSSEWWSNLGLAMGHPGQLTTLGVHLDILDKLLRGVQLAPEEASHNPVPRVIEAARPWTPLSVKAGLTFLNLHHLNPVELLRLQDPKAREALVQELEKLPIEKQLVAKRHWEVMLQAAAACNQDNADWPPFRLRTNNVAADLLAALTRLHRRGFDFGLFQAFAADTMADHTSAPYLKKYQRILERIERPILP